VRERGFVREQGATEIQTTRAGLQGLANSLLLRSLRLGAQAAHFFLPFPFFPAPPFFFFFGFFNSATVALAKCRRHAVWITTANFLFRSRSSSSIRRSSACRRSSAARSSRSRTSRLWRSSASFRTILPHQPDLTNKNSSLSRATFKPSNSRVLSATSCECLPPINPPPPSPHRSSHVSVFSTSDPIFLLKYADIAAAVSPPPPPPTRRRPLLQCDLRVEALDDRVEVRSGFVVKPLRAALARRTLARDVFRFDRRLGLALLQLLLRGSAGA
jgi:hypothetical protein